MLLGRQVAKMELQSTGCKSIGGVGGDCECEGNATSHDQIQLWNF